MKKLLIIIISILLLFCNSKPVKSYEDLGSTPITIEILPSYTINIPNSINLSYKTDDSYIGAIYCDNVVIGIGYAIQVDIEHTPFISKLNPNIKMPCSCNHSHVYITSDKDIIPLDIHVDDYVWDSYPPGPYESTMTFTFTYVKL